jgi:fatty acid desaturase
MKSSEGLNAPAGTSAASLSIAPAETEEESRALAPIRRGWVVDAADKARLLRLEKPDGRRFTAWACFHFAVYGAGIALIPWLKYPAALIAISILLANQLHALTILQHDCGHGSAYASKTANLWVGRFFSFFIFLPYSAFQEVHKWHHWFLGDPKRDPDEWYYAGGPRQLWFREMLFMPYFTIVPLIRYGAAVRNLVLRELISHIALWAIGLTLLARYGRYDILLWGVLLPMAGLAFVISPISRGYEHFPLTLMPRGHKDRSDLHKNSVTLTSRVLGFLWVNITYHVEHHLFPRVPFFALPEAHRILGKRNTYIMTRYPLKPMRPEAGAGFGAEGNRNVTQAGDVTPADDVTSHASNPLQTRIAASEKEVAP